MKTECTQVTFEFQGLFQCKVKARFDGGTTTSDAGLLLLQEVETQTGIHNAPPFTIPFTSNVIYAIDSHSNDFEKTHSMYGKVRVRPPERESMRAFAAQHD